MAERITQRALFLATGDTHHGSTDIIDVPKEKHIGLLRNLPPPVKAVLHVGDFTTKSNPAGIAEAGEIYRQSQVPVLGLEGNHEFYEANPQINRRALKRDGIIFIDEEPFILTVDGVKIGFTGVTGYGGQHYKARLASNCVMSKGAYKEAAARDVRQLDENLRSLRKQRVDEVIVAFHLPPRGNELEEVLEDYPAIPITQVVYGHIHSFAFEQSQTRLGRGMDLVAAPALLELGQTPYKEIPFIAPTANGQLIPIAAA